MGRREIRKRATRMQLIQAGRKFFSQVGLYEARIEDLTDGAGIAKGTLYLYFRNKDALAREVVAMGYEQLGELVLARTAAVGSLEGVIRQLVLAHLEFYAKNPDLFRIFHQARGMLKFDRREWRQFRGPLRKHIHVISEVLRRVPSGLLRSDAARWNLALHVFGSVSGVASVRVVVGPRRVFSLQSRALVTGLTYLAKAMSCAAMHRRSRVRRGR